MIRRTAVKLLLLVWSSNLLFLWSTAQLPARTPTTETSVLVDGSANSTNSWHLVSPGPNDGQIAAMTARLLERFHYLRPRFDGSVSTRFFDRYLETLDPQHLHFLQSDLADFDVY